MTCPQTFTVTLSPQPPRLFKLKLPPPRPSTLSYYALLLLSLEVGKHNLLELFVVAHLVLQLVVREVARNAPAAAAVVEFTTARIKSPVPFHLNRRSR